MSKTEEEKLARYRSEKVRKQYRRDKVHAAKIGLDAALSALAECYDEDLVGYTGHVESVIVLRNHLERQRDGLEKEVGRGGR